MNPSRDSSNDRRLHAIWKSNSLQHCLNSCREFFQGERRAKREMIREAMEKRQLLTSGELDQASTSQASPDPDTAGPLSMAKYSQVFIKPKVQIQPGKPGLGKKTPGVSPGMSPRSNTFV
ncbi:hypothetical protein PoB_000432600 [Plakobranchus ocellatus]|uniref:Uncharacterized protein n=1 Tax=Plakobranchus ocellatus TaxID=259542 RepID=A0AAV3Y3M7_9GAST|nr:hypothetical protein PoB_000432600 [Plakobranchus ocellatus]